MAAFRWVLLLAGLIAIVLVFLYSTGRLPQWRWKLRRPRRHLSTADQGSVTEPGPEPAALPETAQVNEDNSASSRAGEEMPPLVADSRVVTVRIMPAEGQEFPAEKLVLALRSAGMRHGKYGIFHRHASDEDKRIRYSAASLVEPGSFDLTRLKESTYRGVSLFLLLPAAAEDGVALFDEMVATAREIAREVDGRVCDEQGSAFSVQRERYMREEVIQYLSAHDRQSQ